jgi:hypothetical protein
MGDLRPTGESLVEQTIPAHTHCLVRYRTTKVVILTLCHFFLPLD